MPAPGSKSHDRGGRRLLLALHTVGRLLKARSVAHGLDSASVFVLQLSVPQPPAGRGHRLGGDGGDAAVRLDQGIVGTALPTIVSELGGLDKLSWVVTAYLLTATASTPLWGKLSDLYGRRPTFQAAIGVFLAGSALAGLSQTMGGPGPLSPRRPG